MGMDLIKAQHKSSNYGTLFGIITEQTGDVITVDNGEKLIELDSKSYVFTELTEAERALVARRFKGLNYVNPTRLHATIKAVQNFKREGIAESVLADPDQLYSLLRKNFVLFNLINDKERRKTVEAVISKMRFNIKEDTHVTDIMKLIACDDRLSRELLTSFMTGTTLLEVSKRFEVVESKSLSEVFLYLIDEKIIPRSRMTEAGSVPTVAKYIIEKRINEISC